MKVLKKYLLGILCLLFIGIMYSSLATASLGYEYLENDTLLHFWNDYDSYYVNVTSGIQLTNHQEEWWTKNVWCVGITRNYESVYCDDKYRINMAIYTDNSSYINITGGYSIIAVIDGVSYHLQTNLKYHLKDTDHNLTILNSVKNLDDYNFMNNVYFYWKITNINISNNDNIDNMVVNNSIYPLSDVFNFNATNMTDKKIWLGDNVTSESLWLSWNSNDYTGFFNQTMETVKINMGGVNATETEIVTFNWLDALCSWSARLDLPNSLVNITVYNSFEMTTGITQSRTCSYLNAQTTARYNQTALYDMTQSTNLSISNFGTNNPCTFIYDTFPDCAWTVTGDAVGNYSVFQTSYFNLQTKSSGNMTVKINPVAGNDCTLSNLGSSITLSANHNNCTNITASNIIYDCAGYFINASGVNRSNYYAFKINGVSNITIKNCVINNYQNGFLVNNSNNVTLFNNTIFLYLNNQSGGTMYGMQIFNTSKLNLTKNNYFNGTGYCSGFGCFINVFDLYLRTNYAVVDNNKFDSLIIDDNSGDIGGGSPTWNYLYFNGNYSNFTNTHFINGTVKSYNFQLQSSNYNILNNITFRRVTITALNLYASSYNNFSNIFLDAGSGSFMEVLTSSGYNYFNNITLNNSGANGLIVNSVNNTFNNMFLNTTGDSIYLYTQEGENPSVDAVNTSFNNLSIPSAVKALRCWTDTAFKNNTVYNYSGIDKFSGSCFKIFNWIIVNVTDYLGVALPYAQVNITDRFGLMEYYNSTNSNGLTNGSWNLHYNGSYLENHTIRVNKTLEADIISSNFSVSKMVYLTANTCNYFPPYINWIQNASENCIIDYITNMQNNNITCLYTGYIYIRANITNTNIVFKKNTCIYVKSISNLFS